MLKVNYLGANDQLTQLKCDIALLKAQDMQKSEQFTAFEKERDSMRDEMALLRQQVEVYSKDFEMERVSRQSIAGERDNLLQDLRALQRKNQELIETAAVAAGVQVNNPFNMNSSSSMQSSVNPAQRPVRVILVLLTYHCLNIQTINFMFLDIAACLFCTARCCLYFGCCNFRRASLSHLLQDNQFNEHLAKSRQLLFGPKHLIRSILF